MVSGALLDLSARGVQDIFLIGNPQMTHFKTVYKRHTNFAMENIQIPITGDTDFGNKITIELSRKADLVSGMLLELDIPALGTSTTFSGSAAAAIGEMKYIDNIGHGIIDYMRLMIGKQEVDRQYGEWMDIWTLLTDNESQKEGLDTLLDRTGNLDNTAGGTISIPLRFWFCRNPALALPLIALQYHDVEVEIYFKTVSEVTTLGEFPYYTATGSSGSTSLSLVKPDTINTPSLDTEVAGKIFVTSAGTEYFVSQSSGVSGAGTSASPYVITLDSALSSTLSSDESYIKPNGALSSTPSITTARMFAEYIYLDTYEKKQFALSKHRYLIEQTQFSGAQVIDANLTQKTFNINFNLPVKELFWTLQLQRVNRNNDVFNYSNTVAQDIVQGNILSKCMIRLNGIERFEERNADHFRLEIPYRRHTRVPNKYFYMYSFALDPEKHQPTGTANFSKFDSVDMELTMTASNPVTNLKVYALSYNILRIEDGMGGIAFSN